MGFKRKWGKVFAIRLRVMAVQAGLFHIVEFLPCSDLNHVKAMRKFEVGFILNFVAGKLKFGMIIIKRAVLMARQALVVTDHRNRIFPSYMLSMALETGTFIFGGHDACEVARAIEVMRSKGVDPYIIAIFFMTGAAFLVGDTLKWIVAGRTIIAKRGMVRRKGAVGSEGSLLGNDVKGKQRCNN